MSNVYGNVSDKFAGAYKNHEQAAQEREEKKNRNFNFNRDEISWLGLEQKKGNRTGDYERVFRVVGLPWDYRESCYDPKVMFYSEILKEDKKGFAQFIWKQEVEILPNGFVRELGKLDEKWLLMQAYKAITARTWDKNLVDPANPPKEGEENKGGWVYHFADSEFYRRTITGNNRRANASQGEFGKSFYGGKKILLPIIDRHDKWCYEHKHLKLLSSGVSVGESQNGKPAPVFVQKGVAYALYEKILDNVVRWHKHWDLDIIAFKNDKDYEVQDITDVKISDKSKALGKQEPLTEEEMSFAKYDLDKNFQHSSHIKLKKDLGWWFKGVDVVTNNNFFKQLEDLAAQEEEENKKKRAEEAKTQHTVGDANFKAQPAPEAAKNEFNQTLNRAQNQTPAAQPAPAPAEAPAAEAPPERRQRPAAAPVPAAPANDLASLCQTNFKSWGKIPETTQQRILGEIETFKGAIPIWKPGKEKYLCQDVACKFADDVTETELPENIDYCPCCGIKL